MSESPPDGMTCIVAELGGVLVGIASVTQHKGDAVMSGTSVCRSTMISADEASARRCWRRWSTLPTTGLI